MPSYLLESLPGRTNARILVAEHAAELKQLDSHIELSDFARRHGITDSRDFAQFKRSLLRTLDIDYDALREQAQIDRFYAPQSHYRPHL
ncbi:MAG: hypothetical protein ING69_10635 [Rhodocyclaceae bacterium]|nr:hypothetical protein [Rhodocyclaceae bacterium]